MRTTKCAAAVAMVAMLLATTASVSYGLITLTATITNLANISVGVGVPSLGLGNLIQVLSNAVTSIVIPLLGTVLNVPVVLTALVGNTLRQVTLSNLPVSANITITPDLAVLVNGLLRGQF